MRYSTTINIHYHINNDTDFDRRIRISHLMPVFNENVRTEAIFRVEELYDFRRLYQLLPSYQVLLEVGWLFWISDRCLVQNILYKGIFKFIKIQMMNCLNKKHVSPSFRCLYTTVRTWQFWVCISLNSGKSRITLLVQVRLGTIFEMLLFSKYLWV